MMDNTSKALAKKTTQKELNLHLTSYSHWSHVKQELRSPLPTLLQGIHPSYPTYRSFLLCHTQEHSVRWCDLSDLWCTGSSYATFTCYRNQCISS